MPACTMARSSAMRTGAMNANSTAACPSWSWIPMRRRRVMRVDLVVGRLGAGPPPVRSNALESLQLVDEGLERGLDLPTEREQQDDAHGCDEGEDDAVLGHCLAVLALDVVLHPLKQERSEHFDSPLVVV